MYKRLLTEELVYDEVKKMADLKGDRNTFKSKKKDVLTVVLFTRKHYKLSTVPHAFSPSY